MSTPLSPPADHRRGAENVDVADRLGFVKAAVAGLDPAIHVDARHKAGHDDLKQVKVDSGRPDAFCAYEHNIPL
jgi:hypothetical protein